MISWALGPQFTGSWLLHLAAPLVFYSVNRSLLPFEPRSNVTAWIQRAWTGLAFSSIFASLFLVFAWVVGSLTGAVLYALGASATLSLSAGALELARQLTTAGLLAVFTSMAWGYTRGQAELHINEISVAIPNLAATLEGLRLVQLSDIHLGRFMSAERISRYVSIVNGLEPDLLCITGDITDGLAHAPQTFPALGGLRARHGVYAIMGNHDRATGADAVTAALHSWTDFEVLRDSGTVVDVGGASLHLIGLDDRGKDWARGLAKDPFLDELATAVPAGEPSVLLAHRPDLFPQAAELGLNLVLAGHTHGGQLSLPLPGRVRLSLARFMTRYPRGTYYSGGSCLHVNRGLGMTGQPVRIATPREITVITLSGHPRS